MLICASCHENGAISLLIGMVYQFTNHKFSDFGVFLHLSDPMSLTATPTREQSADQWIPIAHRVRFLKKWVYENPRAGARGSTVDHGLLPCIIAL